MADLSPALVAIWDALNGEAFGAELAGMLDGPDCTFAVTVKNEGGALLVSLALDTYWRHRVTVQSCLSRAWDRKLVYTLVANYTATDRKGNATPRQLVAETWRGNLGSELQQCYGQDVIAVCACEAYCDKTGVWRARVKLVDAYPVPGGNVAPVPAPATLDPVDASNQPARGAACRRQA